MGFGYKIQTSARYKTTNKIVDSFQKSIITLHFYMIAHKKARSYIRSTLNVAVMSGGKCLEAVVPGRHQQSVAQKPRQQHSRFE